MPKAAAPSPTQWATTHPNFAGFSIDDLNRVVLEYAPVELETSRRREQSSALARVGGKLLFLIAVVGLAGPLFAAIVLLAANGEQDLSGDSSNVAYLSCVYVGCALGCISLLYRFVPWLRSKYRQWDRSMFGFAVIVLIPTGVLAVTVATSEVASESRWLFLAAPLVTLLLGVGVIVSEFRLYSREKPPAVDVSQLTESEIQTLLDLRNRALRTLRSRSIVSYDDFDDYDSRPLVSTTSRGF